MSSHNKWRIAALSSNNKWTIDRREPKDPHAYSRSSYISGLMASPCMSCRVKGPSPPSCELVLIEDLLFRGRPRAIDRREPSTLGSACAFPGQLYMRAFCSMCSCWAYTHIIPTELPYTALRPHALCRAELESASEPPRPPAPRFIIHHFREILYKPYNSNGYKGRSIRNNDTT